MRQKNLPYITTDNHIIPHALISVNSYLVIFVKKKTEAGKNKKGIRMDALKYLDLW